MQAHRWCVDACCPCRQVLHSTFLAAAHRVGIEQHQVGPGTHLQTAAIFDAINIGCARGQFFNRFFKRHIAPVSGPVAHEVQPEARIA